MELSIDAILLSLLVGVITSLALLSLAFIFVGPALRGRALSKLFRFLIYEDEHYQARAKELQGAESLFAGLLVISMLFGLGVAMESASDYFNKQQYNLRTVFGVDSDEDIRLKSFQRVLETEVRTGRADPALRTVFTDYMACKSLGEAVSGPCVLARKRAEDMYFTAKNTVMSRDTYFQELDKIQSRIDYMRGLSYSFALLFLVLGTGAALAVLAEIVEWLVDRRGNRLGRPFERWWRLQLGGDKSLIAHLKNLSATRLMITASLALMLGFGALRVWGDIEYGYDNRVFGYFICDRCVDDPQRGAASAAGAARIDLPASPFRRFAGPGSRFEPSAIVPLGQVEGRLLFLVANDKRDDRLFLYELEPSGELTASGEGLALQGLPPGVPFKIEALAIAPATADRPAELLIAGTERIGSGFPGAIYRATLGNRPIQAGESPTLSVVAVRLGGHRNACDALHLKRCEIEGLAVSSRDPNRVVIGVRRMDKTNPKVATPVLHLTEFDLRRPDLAPRQVVNMRFPAALSPRCGQPPASALGVSDLTFDSEGGLLILSSYEARGACRASFDHVDPGVAASRFAIHDVQGALWRIGDYFARADGRLSLEFIAPTAHKPEGIAFLEQDSDTVLITYDDDANRKSVDRAPDTFPLLQNESIFSVIKLSR